MLLLSLRKTDRMAINKNNLETKVIKVFYHHFALRLKHIFARAIKSPRKSFGEGNEEGEGGRPHQTKRPVNSALYIAFISF